MPSSASRRPCRWCAAWVDRQARLPGHGCAATSVKIRRMKFQELMTRVGIPVLGVLLVAFAYRAYGWGGVAVALGALAMWMLLHFTRMMAVMRRAAGRPIGYVASAVMLNAKLKRGMTLLHVVAMTRAFGKLFSEKGQQPEVFRWTDNGESYVTCEFAGGKLAKWEMVRPPEAQDSATAAQLGSNTGPAAP